MDSIQYKVMLLRFVERGLRFVPVADLASKIKFYFVCVFVWGSPRDSCFVWALT